jgi:catechol 2,3-dioxygenase-like lactoylglutathione lyase family enzyme
VYVADLDEGLAFYRDRLGHELIWRTGEAAGLRLAGDVSELVLHTEPISLEVDLTVPSADDAADRFQRAGGKVVVPPFDIRVGRAVVVEDPWGNRLVLLDSSKGTFVTDHYGTVVGVGIGPTRRGYDGAYEEALRLAASAHRDQKRKGSGLPYISHPVHVAAILERHGFSGDVVIAGLLHDVVEDQDIALTEIETRFGVTVSEIVGVLSERKLDAQGGVRPWHIRKAEAVDKIRTGSAAAAAVKAADVLHNAQSILLDLGQVGLEVWQRFTRRPDEMMGYYCQMAQCISAKLGDHPLEKELRGAIYELDKAARAALKDAPLADGASFEGI